MKNNILYFSFLFVLLTSCKTKKILIDGKIKKLSAITIAEKHNEVFPDKKTYSSKLKVDYSSPKEKIKLSVQMKIKKDEIIYLKGTKFITVFKAIITPKKIQYYSPFFKNYFEGDFKMIEKFLGVKIGFKKLQNLLLGHSLTNLMDKKQDIKIVNKSYELNPKENKGLYKVSTIINPYHFKLDNQRISYKKQLLQINYTNYWNKEDVFFPKNIKIDISGKKNTKMNIHIKSVNFNNKLHIPFKIPSGYKKLKL